MTAVEFLVSKLNPYGLSESQTEWFEKALEMEKQHIYGAFNNGYTNGILDTNKKAEQYYNETFKNKQEIEKL